MSSPVTAVRAAEPKTMRAAVMSLTLLCSALARGAKSPPIR